MNFKRSYAIFLRQLYLLKRGSRLINIFYWPTLDLLTWGFITIYLTSVGTSGVNFLTLLLSAVLLWNFYTRAQLGFHMAFLEDVWVRNFINLFATPLTVAEYVTGLILTSVVAGILSMILPVLVAWLLFTYNIFQLGFMLIPFLAVLFIFGWTIALFAMAVMFRFGSSAESLTWALPFLFTPFSGVYYPISALPLWAQTISHVLPTSYVFEGMRQVIFSGSFDAVKLLYGFGFALAYFFLAYFVLIRVYKLVLRRGLFTRFSVD